MPDGPIGGVLDGPVEAETRELLVAASGGDPVLLRTLVLTGLSLGDLNHEDGRWRWNTRSRVTRLADLIEARSEGLAEPQLAALRTLSEPWAKPYAAVARASEYRGASCEPGTAPRLTDREQQVLVLVADGLTAAAIARRLYLSPRTVAKYQQRTYRKLGTSDRLATVLRAQHLGLLEPGRTGPRSPAGPTGLNQ
jgi:DNA-binding CsgD family transcriptional regulator